MKIVSVLHRLRLYSLEFWLITSGLILIAGLLRGQERWMGILSITCFLIVLGWKLEARMPQPKPTVQPQIRRYH